jgi:hypothetical protein
MLTVPEGKVLGRCCYHALAGAFLVLRHVVEPERIILNCARVDVFIVVDRPLWSSQRGPLGNPQSI